MAHRIIELDGLPINSMVIFHGYVSHNQMVYPEIWNIKEPKLERFCVWHMADVSYLTYVVFIPTQRNSSQHLPGSTSCGGLYITYVRSM